MVARKFQVVVNKDKGLDMTALMNASETIVPYVLAQVIYDAPPIVDLDNPPQSLREWTYEHIPDTFFIMPIHLHETHYHPDVRIKSPRGMKVGYIELPRDHLLRFQEDVRKAFAVKAIDIKKEWSWIHRKGPGGEEQWVTFEDFLQEKGARSAPFLG